MNLFYLLFSLIYFSYIYPATSFAHSSAKISNRILHYDSVKKEDVIISVHPNPFSDKILLDLRKFPRENIALAIFDQIGNSVYHTDVFVVASESTYEIDTGKLNLKPGIFFLKVTGRGIKTKVLRIIKF